MDIRGYLESSWADLADKLLREVDTRIESAVGTIKRGGKVNAATLAGTIPLSSLPSHTHAGGAANLTVAEIDGNPSAGSVSYIKVTNGKLTDNGGGTVTLDLTGGTATGGGGGTISVQEIDGSPAVSATVIEFPNGTLSDQGGGTARYTPAGGAGGDSTTTAAYASRPAASNDGDLFLPSDGFGIERDTGSAWVPWGPIFPLTAPPAASNWTWDNQGSGTLADSAGGLLMTSPSAAGETLRGLYKAAPSTPYTIDFAALPVLWGSNYAGFGVGWRSSGGAWTSIEFELNNGLGAGGALRLLKWNSATSITATYLDLSSQMLTPMSVVFFRIADDGTNRKISVSGDGRDWLQLHSVGRTDFLTPASVGFVLHAAIDGPSQMRVIHWKQG